jgi:FAD/FMN-containing dehydrogenase
VLDQSALQGLYAGFVGELIEPGDERYDRVRRVWNGMVDRRPSVVAQCVGVEDVRAALEFAHRSGLPVAVRGGGHNVAGNAVCEGGLVIDLSGGRA